MNLTILSPDGLIYEAEDVDEVFMPGEAGDLGVMPDHTPLLTPLRIGVVEVRSGEDRQPLAVAGGFAEVTPEAVKIIADAAEPAEDIDVARAQAAMGRAEGRIRDSAKQAGQVEVERARLALARARNRLKVAGQG